MTEGGAIDWAGHANEAAANVFDVLEFDDAIKVALDFYRKHPAETLIVVTGDHETGAMTMGFSGSGKLANLKLLKDHTTSVGDFQRRINQLQKKNKDLKFDDIKPLLTEGFGFKFTEDKEDPMVINAKELKVLQDGFAKKSLARAIGNVISGKTGIGWNSGAHTALPVLTTSIGCKAELFCGFIENTDISNKIKSLL